jgi:hypothetical protein
MAHNPYIVVTDAATDNGQVNVTDVMSQQTVTVDNQADEIAGAYAQLREDAKH